MIFTDKAAREKIASLEARVSELEADCAAKDAAIDAHNVEISNKDQTIAEHAASLAKRDEELQAISAELAAEKESVANLTADLAKSKEEIEAAKASVPVAVTETLAAIGQNEPLPEVETQAGPVHLTKFNSLKGAEATAYFKAHKKEIAAEQDALRKN